MAVVERRPKSVPIKFVGGSYQSDSTTISAQEAVNIFPEVGPDSANPLSMIGIPGCVLFASLGKPIRGFHVAFGHLYVAAGNSAYKVSPTGDVTTLGTIADDGLPASLTSNVFEVLFVSGGLGYVAQSGASVITQITDPEFPDASVADFIDGYGLLVERSSGRFWFTTINDFESISGIDFATAEGSPDNLVSLLVDHREIWLFGADSTEVWFNSGDATNPFQRVAGGFLERGCRGAYSPAKLDNTVFWLGNNGSVYKADGLTPVRISNHGIEQRIAATTAEPVGMAYSMNGHDFYQLSFDGQYTCVYDASTQVWHTRKNYGRADAIVTHTALFGPGQCVGGDDGNIYYFSESEYTFNGGVIERIRSIGPLRTDGFTVMRSLTAVFETGANSSPIDPKTVFLQISDDSGKTFGDRISASIGSQGQYAAEVKFHGLGGFYDNQRVLKLTMTDDARYALVGMSII